MEVYWNSPKGSINLSRLDQKQPNEAAKDGQESHEGKAVFATKSGKIPAGGGHKETETADGKGTSEQLTFERSLGIPPKVRWHVSSKTS